LELVETLAMIVVVAYLVLHTPLSRILFGEGSTRNSLPWFILIFGAFSIFGTLGGVQVLGGVSNVRDLGPLLAGLLGGPLAGLGAGIVGGFHRLGLGGFSAIPCCTSTILAGLVGGLVHRWRKGKFPAFAPAMVLAAGVEIMHMLITLLIARPFDRALELVGVVVLPMVLVNAMGIGLFSLLLSSVRHQRQVLAEQQKVQSELKIAHDIQASMIPRTVPRNAQGTQLDAYAYIQPAREVGGDLYDWGFLNASRLFFVVGDVAGKGIPAALYMAMVRTLIRGNLGESSTSPQQILEKVNLELTRDNPSGMFVTLFLGILDIPSGELVFANAGHPLPYRLSPGKRPLALPKTRGMPLGAWERASFEAGSYHLGPGEGIFLYTDGITEATDEQGDFFTRCRLEKVLGEGKAQPLDSRAIGEGVLKALGGFTGQSAQADDITIMAIVLPLPSDRELCCTLHINVQRKLLELEKIHLELQRLEQQASLPHRSVSQMDLALEEVVTNVLCYGSPRSLSVELTVTPSALQAVVEDDGVPFDPESLPEPNTQLPLSRRKVGGLGVYLARTFTDQMEYTRNNGKNRLTLVKKIQTGGEENADPSQ